MVAVRSAGLAFGAIIGYSASPTEKEKEKEGEEEAEEEKDEKVQRIVSEEYLSILIRLANERFSANRERTRRFEDSLFAGGGGGGSTTMNGAKPELEGVGKGGEEGEEKGEGRQKGPQKWKDANSRKARKRAEGLAMQKALTMNGSRRRRRPRQKEEVDTDTDEDEREEEDDDDDDKTAQIQSNPLS